MTPRRSLTLAMTAGGLAAVLAWGYFSSQERALRNLSAPAPALVAVTYLAAGARVDAASIEVRQIPRAFIQPGALREAKEAEGQVAVAPIAPGEQILANKLATTGVALALAVPPGKRAIAIAVDAAGGVAGLLKPGDLVDVLVTADEGGAPRTFALMQAAPVLAVGRSFTAKPEVADAGGLLTPPADTVTLAASPYEAAQLAHLELVARLKLALRAPGDRERVPLAAVVGRAVRPAAGDDGEVRKR